MQGETNLVKLLNTMEPTLLDDEYVFTCLPESSAQLIETLQPIGFFCEEEGFTFILPKAIAELHKLPYAGVFKCLTLKVYSSLNAVGLTAAVSGALADNGISANVVAAFYHDHIFVSIEDAELALSVLHVLTERAQ